MTPEHATQHTPSKHLPWDVHGEARVLPSVQTDTQVTNGGVNNSLQGASSCERSQLCPCEWKRGWAAAAAPLTEQGRNQPERGWGSSELQTPNTRDVMTSGTREMMGGHMGGGPQTQGCLPTHLQPLSTPILLLPPDSALSPPFLLFPVLFPPFLIQIPSLTPSAYYSSPLQSQDPPIAGPVLCSFFLLLNRLVGFHSVMFSPFRRNHQDITALRAQGWEAAVLHQNPDSAFGHQARASFPFCSGTNTCTEQGGNTGTAWSSPEPGIFILPF